MHIFCKIAPNYRALPNSRSPARPSKIGPPNNWQTPSHEIPACSTAFHFDQFSEKLGPFFISAPYLYLISVSKQWNVVFEMRGIQKMISFYEISATSNIHLLRIANAQK